MCALVTEVQTCALPIYRVGQGQPVKRTCDGRGAVCRPGPAGGTHGSGVLQRHPEQLRAVAVQPGPDRPAAWPRLPPGSDLMTRTPTRRLLVLALATAITAPAAWAQETVDPQAAFGIAPPQPAANALAPAVRPDSSFTVSDIRSEEHTSELQSLMRISYAVFCLKKKKKPQVTRKHHNVNI